MLMLISLSLTWATREVTRTAAAQVARAVVSTRVIWGVDYNVTNFNFKNENLNVKKDP